MPLLALPTLFTRSVEITGTRTTFHSNHQVLFLGLAIPCILVFVLLIVYSMHRFIKRIRNRDYSYNFTPLPSRLSLFGNGSLRHPEYDLEDGIKAGRITVDDISQPKLLYGTGPFAWDFCNSDNWKQIDEDDNTLIQLEDSRNPFINSDDEDTGQLSTLEDAAGAVNRDGVDFAQTRVVSRSTPKPEYILRSPTEYTVEHHFSSSASAKDHDNDVLNDTRLRDNTIDDLDKTLRNNRMSALISEIEKLGNTLKEASCTREDDSVSDLKPNQYSDSRSEISSLRLTAESLGSDESSMVPEMVNLPICTRRGVLLASRRFVTKEHAQRILLERRIEMQRSPELRFVIPNPFARDPCIFGRASTPAYPCYFSPRPESIKKLRKCLMKQLNTEALYLPAIPSLLVPGSEFFRPRSGNRLTRNAVPPYPRSSNSADDRHDILVLSSAPLRRRSTDRLLVKVLKRAHYDALTANAPLAPMTSDGSDPFSDSCVAQSPFDDPRVSSCPCQTGSLCADHAGTPAIVKRKSSISAQLSIIRSSLKKRSSFGTISGPRIPKGEIKEDGALLESSSVRKTAKNGVLVNQVVDALGKATRVKKAGSISGKDFEKSTRRTSSLARQACSKPRGLSDISNRAPASSLSPGQLPSYPASVKQKHSQHHRKPIASLVLSENLFRHKRTLSIRTIQHPYTLLPTTESPASRNLWTSFSLKRPSSRV
ncbi:hypothetical protein ACEPAI_7366 [Sanghuangporus weigelae]